MTDNHKPPVTSTPVGLIGVSDKDASGYDHKADPLDLDALTEVAREATPGPWETYGNGSSREWRPGVAAGGWIVAAEVGDSLEYSNAEHIATFDPPTVLTLLAALKEARAGLAEAVGALEEIHSLPCWFDSTTKRGGYDVDGDEWNMIRAITRQALNRNGGTT